MSQRGWGSSSRPDGEGGDGARSHSGPERRGRSLAEWVSLGISLVILAGVVGLVVYQHVTRRSDPAVIEVRPRLDEVRRAGGAYYLPLEIANTGGETAEEVVVEVQLAPPRGEPERAEATVRFLAGGGTHRATAVFRSDPSQGTLTATARSLVEP